MDWRYIPNTYYYTVNDIMNILHFDNIEAAKINIVCQQYPMLINKYYFSLINLDNPDDPIRKMAIPSTWELKQNGNTDTSGEEQNTILPGVQHKYKQTLLILSSSKCFMYCRHCFRKRMIGLTNDEVAMQLEQIISYIKRTPSINNVLISGGDSFYNTNDRIAEYLKKLTPLKQLDFIRFGTRAPVVLPQRIYEDNELLSILEQYCEKKQIYIITQFNHPQEITSESILAIKQLKRAGIIVKNQTVLLKGINDSPKIISDLLCQLTTCGVIPYYIFQCRPVRGVLNHFQVPLRKGYQIVEQAKAMQNGQGKCIRYVLSHPTGKIEIIGESSTEQMIFQYHQAKDKKNSSRIFIQKIKSDQCWI